MRAMRKYVLPTLMALASSSSASEGSVVFYLDEHYQPKVRLDRVESRSEGVRAILALYALQNGAGCGASGESGLLKCELTSALGLGENCSEEHLKLVRTWFSKTPNLSFRWNARLNSDAKKPGALEDLCYRQPHTGSWHNVWEILRVSDAADTVKIDGVLIGGSPSGWTRMRYISTYRITPESVVEVRTSRTVLKRSSKSIFEER
jgi:hypothetical protein